MTVTQGLTGTLPRAPLGTRGSGRGRRDVVIEGTVEGGVAARVSLVVNGRVKGDITHAGGRSVQAPTPSWRGA
ncbi:hypothetical protein ACU4GD_14680 [Cupriavidus basilensis]